MKTARAIGFGATLALIGLGASAAGAGELFAHSTLTLHRGPGSNFAVLTTVTPGTAITVLWCNDVADWCLVDDGVMQGWTPMRGLKARSDDTLSNSSDSGAAGSILAGDGPIADGGSGINAIVSGGANGAGVAVSAPGVSAGVKLP